MLKAYSSTDPKIRIFQGHVLVMQQFFEIKAKLPFFFRLILKMPSNLHFSKSEILQIYHLKACGLKVVDIARKTRDSRAGIYQILSKGNNFKTKLCSGQPKKASKWQNREIFRLVSTQNLPVQSISREVIVSVSKSTVH